MKTFKEYIKEVTSLGSLGFRKRKKRGTAKSQRGLDIPPGLRPPTICAGGMPCPRPTPPPPQEPPDCFWGINPEGECAEPQQQPDIDVQTQGEIPAVDNRPTISYRPNQDKPGPEGDPESHMFDPDLYRGHTFGFKGDKFH